MLDYEPTDIDFTFLKKTTKNCILSKKLPETTLLVAEYTDAKQTIYVVEGAKEIDSFQDYDDKPIADSCAIANNIASIHEIDSRYSVIESIIAAYKFLLEDIFLWDDVLVEIFVCGCCFLMICLCGVFFFVEEVRFCW